jgi:hypothetical protein
LPPKSSPNVVAAFQDPVFPVLHHRDAAVDQDHHHDELHHGAGDDVVETRRHGGDSVPGQARFDLDQVVERSVRGKKSIEIPVTVDDQLAEELGDGLDDLGFGDGPGFHVGLGVFFQLQLLRGFFGQFFRKIRRDKQHADGFPGGAVFDHQIDVRALELFDEIISPLARVLVDDQQRSFLIGRVGLVQVAEDQDEKHGKDQEPEKESLVPDRQFQIQLCDMPYFFHDRCPFLPRSASGGKAPLQANHGDREE